MVVKSGLPWAAAKLVKATRAMRALVHRVCLRQSDEIAPSLLFPEPLLSVSVPSGLHRHSHLALAPTVRVRSEFIFPVNPPQPSPFCEARM